MTRTVVALYRRLTSQFVALSLAFIIAAPLSSASGPIEDRNWITVNIWDSFFPFNDTKSFPENLNAIEIMFQQFSKRKLESDIDNAFGLNGRHGLRSREGHYVVWIHLSQRVLNRYANIRSDLGSHVFLHSWTNQDILTGWSGSANLAALIREGVVGFARPVIRNGRPAGGFNSSDELFSLGEPDAAHGWYMTDEQAIQAIEAMKVYPGKTKGYSFMSLASERPNLPFDPPQAQLVNGYNCNDFAFYLLTESGLVSKEEVESLKINLWYPERYFDSPLPLSALGQKGRDWLNANPGAAGIPDSVLAEYAWQDLLFNKHGVEFFYKQQIFNETWQGQLRYVAARVWDQRAPMAWMKRRADFEAKGIVTELKGARDRRVRITEPVRRISRTRDNTWELSSEFAKLRADGLEMERRKLKRNGIEGQMQTHFRSHLDRYKIHW